MVLLNLKSEMKDQLNKVGLVIQTGAKVFMNWHLQYHTTTISQDFFWIPSLFKIAEMKF